MHSESKWLELLSGYIESASSLKEVVIISSSAANTGKLIIPALKKGATVSVYVQNPNQVSLNSRRHAIESLTSDFAAELENEIGFIYRKRLKIFHYSSPPTFRAVVMDENLIAFSPYFFQYLQTGDKSNWELDRLNPINMLATKNSSQFNLFLNVIMKFIKFSQSELQVWEGKSISSRSIPENGEIIDGLFRINNQLGEGASGICFKVILEKKWKNLIKGTKLCMKWYKNSVLSREREGVGIARRLRELDLVGNMAHPNLVRGYGVHQDSEKYSQEYMIMDLVEGINLHDFIEEKKSRVPDAQSKKIIIGIGKALQYLHRKKIIHRDVKAKNVTIKPDGTPILLDLGVAKNAHDKERLTGDHTLLGTLRYTPPEIILSDDNSSGNYSTRSDIYSLGTIVYHLYFGREVYWDRQAWYHLPVFITKNSPTIPMENQDLNKSFLYDFIGLMLASEKQHRPRIRVVIDFFENPQKTAGWLKVRIAKLKKHYPMTKIFASDLKSIIRCMNSLPGEVLDTALIQSNSVELEKFPFFRELAASYNDLGIVKAFSSKHPQSDILAWNRFVWLSAYQFEAKYPNGDYRENMMIQFAKEVRSIVENDELLSVLRPALAYLEASSSFVV